MPGIELTYRGAYHCNDAPAEGTYAFRIEIARGADGGEPIELTDVVLRHTTPRPRGQAPQADITDSNLPIDLASGETVNVDVAGTYALVQAGANRLANLHFCVRGTAEDGTPFGLGVNLLIRGSGFDNDAGQAEANNTVPPPTISQVWVKPGRSGARVTWTTDQPSQGRVVIVELPDRPATEEAGCGDGVSHRADIQGLDPGETYTIRVEVADALGQSVSSAPKSFKTLLSDLLRKIYVPILNRPNDG
ncbi:MAG TPA: fibronectin type III domain-containing protein [Roseiflexaceae bacterium]|nr:fibronectin type III domain-containing protein [Roseiflexaceae bacterium]